MLPGCLCPGGIIDPAPVRVTTATLEAQLDLAPPHAPYRLWATAGPAMIRHGGIGYERPRSPESWGGALGLDFAAPARAHWQLTAAARGIGYSFNLEFPPQHGPQFDVLGSLGLRWRYAP
jgi:hypothetical protein